MQDPLGVVELRIESGLSDEYLKERVEAVRAASIGNHVIAEINLARFIRGVTEDLQLTAKGLTDRLKTYQAEIQE